MTHPRSLALAFLLVCSFACSALANAKAQITDIRFIDLTKIEQDALNDDSGKLHDLNLPLTPYNTARPKVPRRVEVFGDRKEYLADDPVGQFMIYFIGQDYAAPGAALKIEVFTTNNPPNESEGAAADASITHLTSPKVAFLLQTGHLAPGSYTVRATLVNMPGARKIPEYTFTKSAKPHDHVIDFPAGGVPLVVHEQSQIPDAVWPITTGVPLPRHAADATDRFILTENGKPVPAQWTTRATWYPDGSQLKWMGLDFEAKYDNGKPRDYKVVRLPEGQKAPAFNSPLKVTQDDDAYTIDTGAIRFVVSKHHFAGVEKAWLLNPDGSPGALIIDGASGGSGGGGPFLRDERDFLYKASADGNVSVAIEESGPVRVTLYATGWYTSVPNARQEAYGGEKCCLFQTRITAYAGLPDIDFHHRTVITYDTDQKKLRQLGFEMPVKGAERYALGGDGKTISGDLPASAVDPKSKKPLPPSSVWLHQDRFDHFRVVEGQDKQLGEGKQTDGWASLALPDATVTLTARNLWQLYPKEIELSRDSLTFHAWPKHGHVAFTEEESFNEHNYYKLFYAHQGQYMDLKFPQAYFDKLVDMGKSNQGYGRILEQQDINAVTGNGQGTAITNDFRLHIVPKANPADPARLGALYQQNPHAITDPIYNGLTDVEGRFAGRDPKRFPDLEYMFDTAYRGHMISISYLGDYGMWIWPDTHNNWNLLSRTPEMHRWWLNSHYQNVWEDTFLYFRSGLPWISQWAADNTQHYLDIGTVNYNDPRHPLQGKFKGAEYHVKGFTPWGSPRYGEQTGDDYVEVGAHFINPDAGMFRYLLVGDHTGLDLMQAWANAFNVVAAPPPERSRDCVTTLGEMLSYYVNSWDPQALLYIHDLVADIDSHPWKEDPNFPGHPLFHDQWVIRFWELTRDTQVRDRILEWMKPGAWPGFPQVNALAFEWTGDKRYLTDIAGSWVGLHHAVYDNKDNPADPLNGYCGMEFFFPAPSIGRTAPFYMQALIDNGLTLPDDAPDSLFNPTNVVTHPKKDAPPASWFVLHGKGYPTSELAYVKANGANPVITLSVSTYGRPYSNTIAPSYLRITDANGKIVYEDTLQCGALKDKATVTLDPKANPGPWKLRTGNWVMLSWTGPAESITVAPTAQQADAGK